MKFTTKLLSALTVLALACPLFAQGIEKAADAGSKLIQVSQPGVQALGNVPQVGATVSRTVQAGVNASMRTSQAAAEALRASQMGMPRIVGLPVVQIEKPIVLSPTVKYFPRASVKKTLQERVSKTYEQARHIQEKYHHLFEEGGPLFRMGPTMGRDPIFIPAERIYPNAPFLKHRPFNLARQYAANENRHLIRLTPKLSIWEKRMRNHTLLFRKYQQWYDGRAGREMRFVAHQIPDNTSYLLLGNYNFLQTYIPNQKIDRSIANLLDEVQLRQPKREIILLSENGIHKFIWNAMKRNNISFVSLAPDNLPDYRMYFFDTEKDSYTTRNDVLHPLEDMSLHTKTSLPIIEKVRQEHPDALLIVYGDERRIRGYEPFSLGAALRGPNTFTVSFVDEETVTWFDDVTDDEFSDIGILGFDNPELRALFGADIQVRLPHGSLHRR